MDRDELDGILRGTAPIHVTKLAAACLRAVDAAALNERFGDFDECRRYHQLRERAQQVLDRAGGPSQIVDAETLEALGGLVEPGDSVGARALAQALHDARANHFWSYFEDWMDARKLEPGDPFPVPTATTVYDIYRRPLRLSPCPDTRDTPYGICPGGYRGLPSLRLVPACAEADLYLDPRLDRALRPMGSPGHGAGTVAIVVPAETLDERYQYRKLEDVHGEPVFDRVLPRPDGSPGAVSRLIADALGGLRRAGSGATLAVMPELTSTPSLDDAIGEALGRGELGTLQLVVAGSAWIPPEQEDLPGDNRSTMWPRGSDRHHHFKFSWFRHKEAGAERIAHRRKRITILAGPHVTCTTLICKDALETWVPHILQELRVRLVIVPSCNMGVSAFRPFASAISDLGWGTVVLANLPPEPGGPPEYALVCRPAASVGEKETGRVSEVTCELGYKQLILLDLGA